MSLWEPTLEAIPPCGSMPRQIVNLDRDFVDDACFPKRLPSDLSTWIPDGYPRQPELKLSAFRGLPTPAIPPASFVERFGKATGKPVESVKVAGAVADGTGGIALTSDDSQPVQANAPPAVLVHFPA